MPLKRCQANGTDGWKWGDAGKCYTGPNARKKALAQGIAMGDIDIGKGKTMNMWDKIRELFKTEVTVDELKANLSTLSTRYESVLNEGKAVYELLRGLDSADGLEYLPLVKALGTMYTTDEGVTMETHVEDDPLPGRGSEGAIVMFVGASPSKLDTIRKRAFSGMVGKTLEDLYIKPLGLSMDEVYLTNIVKECVEDEHGASVEPTPEQIADALPAFVEEVARVEPLAIVALGKTAHKAIEPIANEWVPHPRAVRIWGNSGEVERKMSRLKKSLAEGDKHFTCELLLKSAEQEQQIVYGVVMEPNENDTDLNWTNSGEIEKAAHYFMQNFRLIDTNHSRVDITAVPVESWITQEDTVMGGKLVKAGSWVMGVHVEDQQEWERIKSGEYTGFSIDALARIDPSLVLGT